MTVTAIHDRRHAPKTKSDDGRLRLTADQLIGRAHALIVYYGHHDGEGFGSPRVGLTLAGAIYQAAGFYEDPNNLIDPVLCGAHRARKRYAKVPPCESWCEHPLWRQCNLAFTYLATALKTPARELPYLDGLTANPRDYGHVVEASETLNTESALRLLARVMRSLGIPPTRPARPVVALAGVA